MNSLFVLRERIKQVYASYSSYIIKFAEFIMGLLVFGMINSNVGFMKSASSLVCTVGMAVVCAFFPTVVMALAACILVLVQFYALSIPIALVSALLFLIMYIFYFRFTPGKAWMLLISALAMGFKIPFIIPVIFGLLGTPVCVVPVACGVIVYYMIHFVKASATALKEAGAGNLLDGLMNFIKQVLDNREMWLMVLIIVIGVLLVNVIRNRSVDHAWKIASAAGAVVCVAAGATADMMLGLHLSYSIMISSAMLGFVLGLILEFFFFSVDYTRTEHVQFEDDEYYYYVKAVPKIEVHVPQKEVKHITEHQTQEIQTEEKPAESKTAEEILLTKSLSEELGLDNNKQQTKQ